MRECIDRACARGSRMLAMALVATALAGLAGCGGDDETTTTSGSGPGTPELTEALPAAKGDVDHITWALPYGEPPTIHPHLGADYSPSFVSAQLCDTLLRQNPDYTITSNLAEVAQPDPKTLVFTLREGVEFWNGKPVTAEDVVYSLEQARKPTAVTAFGFGSVGSIDATGPREVTIRFKQPDELFRKSMTNFGGTVFEKAFAEKAGDDLGTAKGGIMCSGPSSSSRGAPGRASS